MTQTDDKWFDSKGEEPVYTNFRQNLIDGTIATMNKVGEWNRVLTYKNVAVVCQAVCTPGNIDKFSIFARHIVENYQLH